MFTKHNLVVYTCLIGQNEGLNPQPQLRNSKFSSVCITDDVSLSSDDWEICLVSPLLPHDQHRSQRDVKVRPNLYFPGYQYSLYLDNTIVLERPVEELLSFIIESCLLKYSDGFVCAPYHSFRENLLEEFNACADASLDDQYKLFEQLKDYLLFDSELLETKPYWCGILLRNHLHQDVIRFSECWFAHINKYSRRDQLSVIASSRHSEINILGFDLDNHSSSFHKWPVLLNERKYRLCKHNPIDILPVNMLASLRKSLEKERESLEKERESLREVKLEIEHAKAQILHQERELERNQLSKSYRIYIKAFKTIKRFLLIALFPFRLVFKVLPTFKKIVKRILLFIIRRLDACAGTLR